MKQKFFSRFLAVFIFSAIFINISITAASAADSKLAAYEVRATKLDKSRGKLSPTIGASVFSFDKNDIDNLPLGEATSMNQLLLRAPGVTQDSFGQIHVRGEHSNLQYRINGVMLPKGIGSFSQTLDTRFAQSVDLITGALPAQYGYRNAGIVDIKTKTGKFQKGGRFEAISGSYDTLGAAQEVSGFENGLNYYVSASYLQNNRGIENPTSARNASHNDTAQDRIFGYFSYFLDEKTNLNLIVGNGSNRFQLPNNPNQQQQYTLNGVDNVDSATLNANQRETNRYAIASLQGVSESAIDYQISTFVRQSQVRFRDDYDGGLVFNGVASQSDRSSVSSGVQGDFSYTLNDKNILRSGFFVMDDFVKSGSDNAVFAADDDGAQTSTSPMQIADHTRRHAQNYGLYLQNEYRPIKDLALNYGARFDASQSYKNESQISPRFGAVYDLSKATKLHAGYARYFTPPQNELISNSTIGSYQNTTNAPSGLNSGAVVAERSNYYDVGVKHILNENINFGLEFYYKEVQNLLDEGQFGRAIVYSPFNYQRGRIYGAEFTSEYNRDNFSSYFNIATSRAKAQNVVSGQYMLDEDEIQGATRYINVDHDQKVSASAGASYLWHQTRYFMDVIYGSGLSKDFTKHLPSYTTVNAGAARTFELPMINKFNLRFTITNLFDKEYKLRDGSGIGVQAPQYGMRRGAYVIFSKAF